MLVSFERLRDRRNHMFEDALFGHACGAFTGAQNSSPGFLGKKRRTYRVPDEIGTASVVASVEVTKPRIFRARRRQTFSDFRLSLPPTKIHLNLEHENDSAPILCTSQLTSASGGFQPSRCQTCGGYLMLALAFLCETVDPEAFISKEG